MKEEEEGEGEEEEEEEEEKKSGGGGKKEKERKCSSAQTNLQDNTNNKVTMNDYSFGKGGKNHYRGKKNNLCDAVCPHKPCLKRVIIAAINQ